MTLPHLLNIIIHIVTGTVAILLGLYILRTQKDVYKHRRRGQLFVALTVVVCLTAVVGNTVFRFMPVFAVLTLLVSYQLLSGWHVIYTRAAGPDKIDAGLLLTATAIAIELMGYLFVADGTTIASTPVVASTLAGLATLLVYDAVRWLFPKRWHAILWRYEHIYKIVGSLFAMLSAAVGNTVRIGQPWSQLMPSAVGFVVIVWCWLRNYREQLNLNDQIPMLDAARD